MVVLFLFLSLFEFDDLHHLGSKLMACLRSKTQYVGVEAEVTFYNRVSSQLPDLLLTNFGDGELEAMAQRSDDVRNLQRSIPQTPPRRVESPRVSTRDTSPRAHKRHRGNAPSPDPPRRSAGKRPRELLQLHERYNPVARGGKRPRNAPVPRGDAFVNTDMTLATLQDHPEDDDEFEFGDDPNAQRPRDATDEDFAFG